MRVNSCVEFCILWKQFFVSCDRGIAIYHVRFVAKRSNRTPWWIRRDSRWGPTRCRWPHVILQYENNSNIFECTTGNICKEQTGKLLFVCSIYMFEFVLNSTIVFYIVLLYAVAASCRLLRLLFRFLNTCFIESVHSFGQKLTPVFKSRQYNYHCKQGLECTAISKGTKDIFTVLKKAKIPIIFLLTRLKNWRDFLRHPLTLHFSPLLQ